MGEDDRPKRPKDVGFMRELMLSDLLKKDGVKLEQSGELDNAYATDFLVTSIDGEDGGGRPIAVQVTKAKKRHSRKMRRFFGLAVRITNGPLLYVEMGGEPTPEMAASLKEVMLDIWRNGTRKRQRGYAVIVFYSGSSERYDPYRYLLTGEHPGKVRRKRQP